MKHYLASYNTIRESSWILYMIFVIEIEYIRLVRSDSVDLVRPVFTMWLISTTEIKRVHSTAVNTGKGQEDTIAILSCEPHASYAVHHFPCFGCFIKQISPLLCCRYAPIIAPIDISRVINRKIGIIVSW